jgi:predicted phosphodiesterase
VRRRPDRAGRALDRTTRSPGAGRRRVLLALELAGVGVLGALLAVLVAGTVERQVGPFEAALSLHPALTGGTQVAVPPLGELQLDTHDGPVLLEVGITQLREDAARSIAQNPSSLRDLGRDVDADLRAGLRDLVLRTVVVTVVGAAALGLLVFRRLRRTIAAAASGLPADGTLRVLHISDLHLDPAAYDIVESVVEQFRVDVVVDTGDSTELGSTAETRSVEAIGGSTCRTSGSAATTTAGSCRPPSPGSPTRRSSTGPRWWRWPASASSAGAIRAASGTSRPAARLRRRSWSSSASSCGRPTTRPRRHRTWSSRTTRRQRGPLVGGPPVVLAGHTHDRRVETEDGTMLLVQGSTGGAGLRALRGEEPTPVALTVLYLDPVTKELQAYDDITLSGVGASDARISRQVVAEPEPSSDPAELGTGSAADNGTEKPTPGAPGPVPTPRAGPRPTRASA